MKLVWHAENLREADWLRDILGELVEQEIIDVDLSVYENDTIHIVSSIVKPISYYEDYFRECRSRCKRLVLFHASDEWYSGGYSVYKHFDLIIRNYYTYLANAPGVKTIPLGYPNGTPANTAFRPASERAYAWSFIGEVKASRVDMVRAFETFPPNLLKRTSSISDSSGFKVPKAEFDEALSNSVFSPCPMGNVNLETWRLYESLERGCIPLLEKRLASEYFTSVFGRNPLPLFANWAAARRFAETVYADKAELNRLQRDIAAWWVNQKADIRARLQTSISGRSYSAELQQFAALQRNRLPVLHQPLRLLELLRHQNGGSLRRRLARPGQPLRRIFRESSRSV